MTRWLLVLITVAFLVAPVPAQAAGCVVARDPAGDASHLGGLPDPDHDLLELSVDATPLAFRFRIRLERVSDTKPALGSGHDWVIRLTTPRDGLVHLHVLSTYQSTYAGAGHLESNRPGYPVAYELKSREASVVVELPYAQAGLVRGDRVTVTELLAGPYDGLALPTDERDLFFGRSHYTDTAYFSRTLAAGVGCR